MKIESRTYVQDNATYREQLVPPMFVVIDVYTPASCPWDVYGRKHQRELTKVLLAAGIESVSLYTSCTINNPVGSGPGGMVRFGDNMTPGEYRIAVYKYDVEKAQKAIAAHREVMDKWIAEGGPLPEVCRDN